MSPKRRPPPYITYDGQFPAPDDRGLRAVGWWFVAFNLILALLFMAARW